MDSPREELNELRRQIAAAPKPVQDDIHEAALRHNPIRQDDEE